MAAQKNSDVLPPPLIGSQFGVWRLVKEREQRTKPKLSLPTRATLSILTQSISKSRIPRFLGDVYRLAPALYILYIAIVIFMGINEALKLYCLNTVFGHVRLQFYPSYNFVNDLGEPRLRRQPGPDIPKCQGC